MPRGHSVPVILIRTGKNFIVQKYIWVAILALGASGAQAAAVLENGSEPSTAFLMGLSLTGLAWAGSRDDRS